MSGFDVTISSHRGQDRYLATDDGVAEKLHEFGVEFTSADYLHHGETVITIRPSTITAEQELARLRSAIADIINIGEQVNS